MLRVAKIDRRLQREREAALRRGDMTAAEWRDLKALLAAIRGSRGRPPENSRAVINGILWRLRTGAPWRNVPGRYGDWNKIYRRFRRWCESGVWGTVATALGIAGANGDGKAAPELMRADGQIRRRRVPRASAAFDKQTGGAGFTMTVHRGTRAAANLAPTRRSSRPTTR
jgi:transposase